MTTTSDPPVRSCLIDTNVLLRVSQNPAVARAYHRSLLRLQSMQAELYTTFQNISEFWNVATRPEKQNGLDLPRHEVEKRLRWIEREFAILTEDEQTYRRWTQLLLDYKVSGRQVHDARLAAHMQQHNVPHLLTANTKDFERYPFIKTLNPEHWKP